MPKRNTVLSILVLIATGLALAWLPGQLHGKLSIPAVSVVLGIIIFIGISSVTSLDDSPISALMNKGEKEEWEVCRRRGKFRFVLSYIKGVMWFLVIFAFLLIRDYIRIGSIVNYLGVYAAIIMAAVFTFSLSAIRFWEANEKTHKPFSEKTPQHNNSLNRTRN